MRYSLTAPIRSHSLGGSIGTGPGAFNDGSIVVPRSAGRSGTMAAGVARGVMRRAWTVGMRRAVRSALAASWRGRSLVQSAVGEDRAGWVRQQIIFRTLSHGTASVLWPSGEESMPTTVADLFANAGLRFDGPVRWSQPIGNERPGVYVVSLSNKPDEHLGLQPVPSIALERVAGWIARVPSIELDGARISAAEVIAQRLAEFWLPDESILYIGMTKRPLQERVHEYYNTVLGAKAPHSGGHWLKTLADLSVLYLYHAACDTPKAREGQLLGHFVENVSSGTKSRLRDPIHPFPFANLEYPQGRRKAHGIGKSTR